MSRPTPAPSGHRGATDRPAARRSGGGGLGGIRLGTILGFEISLDYSWFIIFFLILASFIAGFPAMAPDLSQATYIVMALVATFLFFASLLGHELAHSVVARWRDVEVEGITLFIFGGMARTRTDATSPGDEFQIAGVGPLASFLLAFLFWLVAAAGVRMGIGAEVVVVAEILAYLNLLLAVFNLFPGFPLDGGRLLRAILWKMTGNMRHATRVASNAGRFLGYAIMAVGILALFGTGALVGGLWFIFIGWFLAHAARASYQQVLLRDALGSLSARQAMTAHPETVPPDMALDTLIHQHFLRRPYNAFPVAEDGVPVGLVTLSQVKDVERERWTGTRVADVMSPLVDTLVVDPDTPMTTVLERMSENGTSRVLVAREWELEGIITGTDITRWLDRARLLEGA